MELSEIYQHLLFHNEHLLILNQNFDSMSFNDNPFVDNNSTKSEESVIKVKTILSQKNGFISRLELPDYGVDLDVELIESKTAASQKFPVQIKSSSNPKYIDVPEGNSFISLEFKTSRLGYLCKRAPASGIIVIYDDTTQLAYFDYVEDIVSRINKSRTDDWKSQKSINIHIPLRILNEASAQDLHTRMLTKHKNHELLLRSHGENYGIIYQSTGNSDTVDFNAPQQIIKFLEDYGGVLFNKQQFYHIEHLLSKLSHTDILKSDILVFLAAITYGQLGNVIEAEYYIERFDRRKNLPQDFEKEIVEFARIRIEFLKGSFDYTSFLERLEKLKSKSQSPLNVLTLEINLTFIRLLDTFERADSTINFEQNIDDLFHKIAMAPIQEKDKKFLTIHHSQNLNTYSCSALIEDGSRLKIQYDLKTDSTNTINRIKKITGLIQKSFEYIDTIYHSCNNDDKMLKAYSLHSIARYFLNYQYSLMILSFTELFKKDYSENAFEGKINQALSAFNLCAQLNLHEEAHKALGCAYELKMIYWVQCKKELGKAKFTDIEIVLKDIERTTGIQPFNSDVEAVYNGIKEKLENKNPNNVSLKNRSDKELEEIAAKIIAAYEIPVDRISNLLASMMARRTFEEKCNNPDIILWEDSRHLRSKETMYASKTLYVITNKKTGVQSLPSDDIHYLLRQYSVMLKSNNP